ncbi:trypsin-like peptidase domain-containing protein [Streptomyces sp. NPDC046915]|uniref:trypsin-like peptidase domain-containing protein n=1 Tax=Streptomyces sp. NPDC046915 TaxID=3155257 RepID=UPI0033F3873D
MAGRGPRTGGGTGRDREDAIHRERRRDTPGEDRYRALDARLVRIRDLAGRPRGTGFLADHHGTLVTSHEAVDGLTRLVLCTADERTRVVTADAVTPLPALALALVRTEGLGVEPLPVSVRDRITSGAYVRIAAGGWREARVLGATQVTYTATDRFHLLDDALELAMGTAGRDALRLGGGAAGGPVLDPETGAVLGVLGTALRSGGREAGFAVPLRAAADGRLAELLDRNAATVPAYGADLNLAGVLELTATSVGQDGPPGALAGHVGRLGATRPGPVEPVERAEVVRQLTFTETGRAAVLGLVGAPGSGRTTELAALAARRGRGPEPAPTLWLRGADLEDADGSVADAAHRALERAARIIAASRTPLSGDDAGVSGGAGDFCGSSDSRCSGGFRDCGGAGDSADAGDPGGRCGPAGPGDVTPECLARVARRVGRPLLLLLDGPEEMPPVLAHRLPEWTAGTAQWLRATGARLVVACREEYWESAGAEFPPELLYPPAPAAVAALAPTSASTPAHSPRPLPPCVRLPDLTPDEARRARARYALPDGALTDRDARHPLTLSLLSEVRAALPPDAPATPADRHEVFSAYLDLMCLRVAVRLAAGNGLRGTAVRRLAARVSGQVHEAARRSLGPGQGELDRATFESVFPWGPAPAWLGRGTGWASAVLTEGLLVPAGNGYRFAHEELADWIQGMHLDLDEALHALVHRRRAPQESHPLPVPHHRVGPVVQSLLFLARQHGAAELARRLEELVHALDTDPASWWAARLLSQTLSQVPDATPYTGVLRLLADRIVARRRRRHPVSADFGPAFWTALPIPDQERFDLLRRLVQADAAPQEPAGAGTPPGPLPWPGRRDDDAPAPPPTSTRYLDAVARLLAAGPTAVQPHLTRWFDDERPLPATPHATVATAAQALLHTYRHGALDDLTEVLVDSAHRRGDQLLTVLAEDEASAVCRAVDRWAHDERPARRVAAVAYGLRAAPHVRTEADRELLRYAALALLARPADAGLHGGALALLVRDPHTRARHLPLALRQFATGDPQFPPSALVPALATDPDQVLEAFRVRLRAGVGPGSALRTLADVTTPALAGRVAALVREVVALRPETAEPVAAYVDRRLDQGPAARAVLLPLVTGLLVTGPTPVRTALAAVLATPGTPASRPLRQELLEFLLTHEHDPTVLDALLHAAAQARDEDVRDLVHRTGLLLVRTPDGATRLDRGLVDLGRHVPGFAALMARWLTDTPEDWAAVVGPSTRRMIGNLAGVRVPA